MSTPPPSTLDQFIRFGTDAAGIERMLRMVQAVLMVVLSQPVLTSGFFKLVALGNQHVWTEPRMASTATLGELRGKVALARRFFRMFRFLESFRTAHVIYTSFYAPAPAPPAAPPRAPATSPEALGEEKATEATGAQGHTHGPRTASSGPPAEAWLDIFGRTFNGMYLLLETLTLADALELPGLPVWGAARTAVLHVEGQRLWFLALACGLLGGLLRIAKLVAHGPGPVSVPRTGGAEGAQQQQQQQQKEEEEDMPDWQRQRDRMRRVARAQREGRRAWRRALRTRGSALARRCAADLFDLPVPGSVVGWVRVGPGTVGAAMVVSTWLTGAEVWERCGREIGRAAG